MSGPRPCINHCDGCLRYGLCWASLLRWLHHDTPEGATS